MVDLQAKPFNLDDEGVKWVQDTISSMSIDEKIGQLFFNLTASRDEAHLKEIVTKYHIGGARYNNAGAKEIHAQNKILQENSKIPLIIAANTEAGGNGACSDGTMIGDHVKIGATDNPENAYEFGRMANKEAQAIGCNVCFAPICDINLNWRNPIISNRCFSNDADTVAKMSVEYMKGAMANGNFACTAKHFPGDGLDERDQHLAPSINSYDTDRWMNTYGKVYTALIEAGLPSIMAGHIMLPSWEKELNPSITEEEMMPATLSKPLLTGLLREKLGFNGMIVTDASHMVGLTCMMKRKDMLPAAIAAGCDMFLFFNDLDEDFGYMKDGYTNGIITDERLHDALQRILALKASMGLHKVSKDCRITPAENIEKIVGCEEHKNFAKKMADESITLIKNKQNIFPLTPEKYKRIMIVPVGGAGSAGLFALMGKGGKPAEETLKAILEAKGFEVSIFEDPIAKIQQDVLDAQYEAKRTNNPDLAKQVMGKGVNVYMAAKSAVKDFVGKQDLIITLGKVKSYGSVVERVHWGMGKGGGQIPWYVHELPVVVASVGHPFLLPDVPFAKTYINCYDSG
ncbi:MAG: glycoside hydrolase family 3 N-terminal domain-containing protein, partial [Spirochaetales bacterium]